MRKILLLAAGIGLLMPEIYAQHGQQHSQESISLNSQKVNNMETKAKDRQSFNEYQAIVKAIQPYIDGARTGDGNLSSSVFYEHAHILGSIDGQVSNQEKSQFAASVNSLGAAENIQHHIAWIDISGPAAAAKIEFQDWLGFRFTDFFVLFKKDGEWKVSGKTFDSHSRN